MTYLKHSSDEELEEVINEWLDSMMAIYGDILTEWEDNKIVQPFPGAHVEFNCNNCGKCCEFADHWVWVYPSDMVHWLKRLDSDDLIPLLLCILFPVEDNEGAIGYGLPSQRMIVEKYAEFIKTQKDSKIIQRTFNAILDRLKKLNPDFNETSDNCIFYNSKSPQHCQIYWQRPLQCRTYPYDFPQFSRIAIPKNLEEKYGCIPDDLEDLPLCPPNTYQPQEPKKGVMVDERGLECVVQEKANYITSIVTQELQDVDISDAFLELFHKDLLMATREKLHIEEGKPKRNKKGGKPSQSKPPLNSSVNYIAGNRPKRQKK